MILPYLARLLSLSLASFFLVHCVFGLLISALSPSALRYAERLLPGSAARFLLGLRLLPVAFALFAALGLCIPSYITFEPMGTIESARPWCVIAALLGAAVAMPALARVLWIVAKSYRFRQHCQRAGVDAELYSDVWILEAASPCLALAGILRPRIVISRGVLEALSADELSAALRHERAHRVSRDNLKRLLVALAPDLFPLLGAFRSLEQNWVRFSEWAADDLAAAGDGSQSVSLAGALVRVARMGAGATTPPLATALVDGTQDLAKRVERLLRTPPDQKVDLPVWGRASAVVVGFAAIALLLQPGTLFSIHELLEYLVG